MTEKRWAQYSDLREMDQELMNAALEASYYYVYDAANLCFTLHSSTSGMYGSWHITVDPSCTVYLSRRAPSGSGGHINDALQSFIDNCKRNAAEEEAKEKPRSWFHVTERLYADPSYRKSYITNRKPEEDPKMHRIYDVVQLVEESKALRVLKRVYSRLESLQKPENCKPDKLQGLAGQVNEAIKEIEDASQVQV